MEIAMPLARIDLVQGKSDEYRRTIGDVVYEAMVDILKRQRTTVSRSSMSIRRRTTLPTRTSSASVALQTVSSSSSP
jgi:hypothetical protein